MSSSEFAIVARGVSKKYTIVHNHQVHATLAETVLHRLKNRFRPMDRETFWALRDTSFEVRRGEVLGIIGRNGAGKSTLLKVLSRITEPSEGRIDMYGRIGSLLEVGTGFHPELTGRENIYLNGSILGMTRREITRKFDEIVDFAGTERFLDTPVKRYSSGMYVRLAFAVAAHLDPEILIVDEVLAVGDAEFQRKCLGKMGEVAKSGRTVLFVSHNMAAIRSLCTRALFLQNGKVVREGTPEECIDHYLSVHDLPQREAEIAFGRPPEASAWMRTVRVISGDRPSARFMMGEPLTIEIDFEAEAEIRPNTGMVVFNAEGVGVLHFSTRFAPQRHLQPTRGGTLRFDFGQVPLTAGNYTVAIYFGGDVDTHIEHNAVGFEVMEKDMFGAGRAYQSKDSLFWWPVEVTGVGAEVCSV